LPLSTLHHPYLCEQAWVNWGCQSLAVLPWLLRASCPPPFGPSSLHSDVQNLFPTNLCRPQSSVARAYPIFRRLGFGLWILREPHPCIVFFLMVTAVLFPSLLSAQDSSVESVHWAYSAFLGSDWYELDNNRQVYVLRIPPRWYFRDSSIDDFGQPKLVID